MAEIGAAAVIGVISAGIGAATSIYSISEQQKAKKDEKKARALERARMEEQERKNKRQQIRKQRITAATIANFAAQTNTSSSSGPQGGIGSVNSQTASNIGFGNTIAGYNNAITDTYQSAQNHISRANAAMSFGSIGQSLFTAGGNIYNSYNSSNNNANRPTNSRGFTDNNQFLGYSGGYY